MPIDPAIPLAAGNFQQPDVAKIYATALQLRQLKRQEDTQNALRSVMANPEYLDNKSGTINQNGLKALMSQPDIDPTIVTQLADQAAQARQREAQTAKEFSDADIARGQAQADAFAGITASHEQEIKDGTDPKIAEDAARQRINDYIDAESISDENKAKAKSMFGAMSLKDISAYTMTAQQRLELMKEGGKRTPVAMGGQPFNLDEQGRLHDPNDDSKIVPVTSLVEKEPTLLDPARAQMEQRRLDLQQKAAEGGAAAITDDDLRFAAEMVLDGQPIPNMGFGKAGSELRAKVLHKAAQMANEQSGSPEAGADAAVVRKEVLPAEKASLTGVLKQQASVRQFSETALGLVDKITQTMQKGTTAAGPEWFAGLMQKIRTGQLGDPDVREFLGYITDLESENAKIMAGATGSVAQVSAHNQALMNQILKGDMPASEMEGALKTIREGIRLRNEALDREVHNQRDQLADETAGGGKRVGAADIASPMNKADYDALPSGAHYRKPGDPAGGYRIKK